MEWSAILKPLKVGNCILFITVSSEKEILLKQGNHARYGEYTRHGFIESVQEQ